MRGLVIVVAWTLLFLAPAKAAEDLSGFGTRIDESTSPAKIIIPKTTARGNWPVHVCAEIQNMERLVIEDARPTDRSFLRIGLLFLQKKHCGVDISAKLAADQKIHEDMKRQADQDFQENMEAAARSASSSRPAAPVIIQVPQPGGSSRLPDPSPSVNCFTTRLGGGMSTTSCR